MGVDPQLIAALEDGVARDPDNLALRVHLIDLLLEGEEWQAADGHCRAAVALRPDDREVLERAARAADGTGDPSRADAYRRLAAAISGEPTTEQPAKVGASGEPEDEYDAFLREVLIEANLEVERPTVTLADVGGLAEVKRRLHTSFLGPMRNPELQAMYATSLRGGLLLYGPPGCGKTFLARALAGELKARFFAVGLHDVLDMWLGQSERHLHELFETARRSAPCVLFLDEVDALGLKRSNLAHSAGRGVVVQLLSELDSMVSDNAGVFVLGATNQPWDLDPAFRRPGRFDRMMLVLPPDEEARAAIIEHHLQGRPTKDIDVRKAAKLTEGCSGADLRLVCDAAAELALEASIQSGTPRPIDAGDLARAVRDVKPSTRPWFEVAKNYAMFANADGTYDDLLAYMRANKLG